MKELPALFCTDMVKAILDDRKNVTRRLDGLHEINKEPSGWEFSRFFYNPTEAVFKDLHDTVEARQAEQRGEKIKFAKSRYQEGDLLYVRECFGITSKIHPLIRQTLPMFEYTRYSKTEPDRLHKDYELLYKATQEIDPDFPIRWRPSIHMPKFATRLWLEVIDVRAERLQEITESDCWAEGIDPVEAGKLPYINNFGVGCALATFSNLWDSLNAKRGYPWSDNPWVWRYAFKRTEAPKQD